MRIRKHARISAPSFSEASIVPCERATLQTHVCELNRSPWDVMTVAPQSDLSYPDDYQVERDDSVSENRIVGEPVHAFKSVGSSKEEEEEVEEESERRFSLLVDVDEEKRGERFVCCNKTDGKGWQCRREAKEGHSLCEHHLTQLRSYHYNSSHSSRKSDEAKAVASSRRRNRGRVSSSTTPKDFYYYSGFGPLWGKKRGGGETKRGTEAAAAAAQITPSSHVVHHHDHDDDDEDDDDDDDDDGGAAGCGPGGGDTVKKKRVRKPVKARSLKSLL